MIHVLTVESEYNSALRLGYGEDNTLTENGYTSDFDNDLVIRWGNSYQAKYKEGERMHRVEYKRVINPRIAIRLNCNKPVALGKLSTVVDTPKLWFPGDRVPAGETVVYRADRHAGGSGFNVQNGPFTVDPERYATGWLQSDTEFRVWFCGNSTMCGVRWKRSECTDKYPCRSLWGYDFKNKVPLALHTATLRAAGVIGLECGAADVLYLKGKYYFLELNSAVTIDKLVIEEFYRDRLKKLIRQKYPDFKQ